MLRGETRCSTKKIANATTPARSPRAIGVEVVVADGGDREQHDRHERQRVDDPVRQDEVLEVDDREHDERERRARGYGGSAHESSNCRGDRAEQHAAHDRDAQPAAGRRGLLVGASGGAA